MLFKNGLMIMLSLASVSGQIIDCAPTNDSSSGDMQATKQGVDSPFDCPLDLPTSTAQNSTQPSANNNMTLFQLLNSTNSPVPKFMTLIHSSPEFQPLIDILSGTANHTVFLPCDQALDALSSMENTTQQNQTTNSTSQQSNEMIHRLDTSTDANRNQTSNMTISEGIGNFSLVDILKYHVINGSWPIRNISHGIHVNETLMSNETAYPLSQYAPLVMINNATNHSSIHTNGTTNTTHTIVSHHVTLLASNATNTTTHQNMTSNFTVGNGIGFAKLVVADITAKNGILHIIDKVLVPPVSTTSAIEQLNETKVNEFLNKSSNTSSLLNSANNVTIFLPSDEALQNYTKMNGGGSQMDSGSGQNGNSSSIMDRLIKNHIVNGTYYTTNITSPLNVTTLDGNHIMLNGTSNGTLFKVGNATIVKPDVLTNRAVVMVIDQVLKPNQTASPTASPTTSSTQTESATSTTAMALCLAPSSLAHILGTCSLISLLVWSMV